MVKKSDPIIDYKSEYFQRVLKQIPTESIDQGHWKIYRESPGRNGGTIRSFLGKIDYLPDIDLQSEILEQFVPQYGGGMYILQLHDFERKKVVEVPPVHIHIPGEPKIGGVAPSDAAGQAESGTSQTILNQERAQTAYLQAKQQNMFIQSQIDKLDKSGASDDPMKTMMADLLRSKLKGEDDSGRNSTRETIELMMMMKTLNPEPVHAPPANTAADQAYAGIMQAVTGLIQMQAQMSSTNMQTFQTVMTQSMEMIQQVQSMGGGKQDPWTMLVQSIPDILAGLGNIAREVKDGIIEVKSAQAGAALERAGQGAPQGLPAPRPQRPPPGGPRNDFLTVVYENYRRQVPAEITADQIQYYLTEQQLAGVLSMPAPRVLQELETQGLGAFFQKEPALKAYVQAVVEALQKIYHEASEAQAAAPADGKATT